MKRIFNAIKWAWTVYRRPQVFQEGMLTLLERQTDFLKEVAESDKPRMAHMGFIYTDEVGVNHEHKLLTLWCSTGTHTVMERVEELAKENARLRGTITQILDSQTPVATEVK